MVVGGSSELRREGEGVHSWNREDGLDHRRMINSSPERSIVDRLSNSQSLRILVLLLPPSVKDV